MKPNRNTATARARYPTASTGTSVWVTRTIRVVPPKMTTAIMTVTATAGTHPGSPKANSALPAMVLTWNPGNTNP